MSNFIKKVSQKYRAVVAKGLTVFLSILTALWSGGILMMPVPSGAAGLLSVALVPASTVTSAVTSYQVSLTTVSVANPLVMVGVTLPEGTTVAATLSTCSASGNMGAVTCTRDGENPLLVIVQRSTPGLIAPETPLQVTFGPITNPGSAGSKTAGVATVGDGGYVDGPTNVNYNITAGAPTITAISTSSGPVGTLIGIAGTNFGATQGTSLAKIGTTNLTIMNWSDTAIRAILPAGATTGNVTVTVSSVVNSGTNTFTVAASSAPAVTDTMPMYGESTLPTNIQHLGMMFNRSMSTSSNFIVCTAANTPSGCTVSLTTGGTYVNGTVNYISSYNQIDFSPGASLAGATTYNLSLSTGVRDMSSNALAAAFNFRFTTGSGVDSTPPQIASSTASTSQLTVMFSKDMNSIANPQQIDGDNSYYNSVVNINNYTLTVGGLPVLLTPANNFINYDGQNRRVTIRGVSLTAAQAYSLTVNRATTTAGVRAPIKDYAGNILSATGNPSIGTVSSDNAPIVVMGTMPSPNQVNVPQFMAEMRVFFDKPLNCSTVSSTTITLSTGGNNVSGVISCDQFDNSVRFQPVGTLTASTVYAITVVSGANGVKSTNGIAMVSDYTATFTTSSGGGVGGGGGAFIYNSTNTPPPNLAFTNPGNGMNSHAVNAPIAIGFTQPMRSDTLTSANLIVETDASPPIVAAGGTYTYDSTTNTVRIAGLTLALSTDYRLRIIGGDSGVKSAVGIAFNPGGETRRFRTMAAAAGNESGADITKAQIVSIFPQPNQTGVPTTAPIDITFNKSVDPSTVNANSITLAAGATAVSVRVDYDPGQRRAFIIPGQQLSTNTEYTLTVKCTGSSYVRDFSNNPCDGNPATDAADDKTSAFTTSGTADTSTPQVVFVNANVSSLAVKFNKPMNNTSLSTSPQYTGSVYNPQNYTFQIDAASPPTTAVSLGSASFDYDPGTMTVNISGLTLTGGHNFCIKVSSAVQDLANNAVSVSDDFSKRCGPVNGATANGGMAGTGGGGGFSGPMMFNSAQAFPRNRMAGQTTIYDVEVPISQVVPIGGKLAITFPTGTNVSGAKRPFDGECPSCTDFNSQSTGVVTFKTSGIDADATGATTTKGGTVDDGITIDSLTGTTVFVHLAVATQATDFLRFAIAGITNALAAADTTSSGMGITAQTMNGTTALETVSFAPIFLGAAGTATLHVTVNAGTASGTVILHLDSPMSGPRDVVATLTNGTGTADFTSLSAGNYTLFTDPFMTIGATDFAPNPPQMVNITSGTTNLTTTLASLTGSPSVTGTVTGVPTGEKIDIFMFGDGNGGGAVKSYLILEGANNLKPLDNTCTATAADAVGTYTLKAPVGNYRIGMGPCMAKGMSTMSGPPPMPTYMPPSPAEIAVGALGATRNFSITSASARIVGKVTDTTGTGIPNAGITAYVPGGGANNFAGIPTSTLSDGSFSLPTVVGSYQLQIFVPGLLPPLPTSVVVRAQTEAEDGNSASDVYVNGALITASNQLLLKVAKSSSTKTISGQVTDGTNPIANTNVNARRIDGPGGGGGMTDTSGNYTLYLSAGTYKIDAIAPPPTGFIGTIDVTVADADLSGKNFTYSTSAYGTISGTIVKGGAAASTAFVGFERTDQPGGNGTTAAADGTFSVRVPYGTYRSHVFIPGQGELPSQTLTVSAGSPTATYSPTDLGVSKTITVTFKVGTNARTVSQAFVDFETSTGFHVSTPVNNASSVTLQVPDGSYTVHAFADGMGDRILTFKQGETTLTNGAITISGNTAVDIIFPTLTTVTGTVTSDGTTGVQNAFVSIINATTGATVSARADSSGDFSVAMPAGSYTYSANAPGFSSPRPAAVIVGATAVDIPNTTLTSLSGTRHIDGTVYKGSSSLGNEATGGFITAVNNSSGEQIVGVVDASGDYTINVPNTDATYTVNAACDGYRTTGTNAATVSVTTGAPQVERDLVLPAISGFSQKTKADSITNTAGGTVASAEVGASVTIPPSALSTDSGSATVTLKTTTNIPSSASLGNVVGSEAVEITATNQSGTAITNLASDVTFAVTVTKADLTEAGITLATDINKMQLATVDATANNNWVPVPTTIDASNCADFSSSSCTVELRASTSHFSIVAPIVPVGDSPPTTPTNLFVSNVNSTSLRVAWTAVSGATSYDVYRSTSSGGTYSRLGSEPTTTEITYTDTGLTTGITYYYKVSALNGSGESAASATPADGRPQGGGGGGAVTPSAPTNVAVVADGASAILTWNDPTDGNLSSLIIVKNGVPDLVHAISAGVKRYVDTNVTRGSTYTYKVRAMSLTGSYSESTAVSVTIPNLVASNNSGSSGGGGGGAYVPPVTVTPTTTTTTPVTTTTTPALTANDIFPTTVVPVVVTPSVSVKLNRSTPKPNPVALMSGTYAFGVAQVSDKVEQANTKTLKAYLERMLGKKTWASILAKKGNGWYLGLTKAYIYGGYSADTIRLTARGNTKLIHPTLSYPDLKKAEVTAKNALTKYNQAKTALTKAKNAKVSADKLVVTRTKAVATAEDKLVAAQTDAAEFKAMKAVTAAQTALTKAETSAKVAADKLTAANNAVTAAKIASDKAAAALVR